MPPLTLMIKPASGLCNLRCSYCFYADVTARRETASYGLMTDATLENLMRRAFAYADGFVSFAFQGGEPTLAGKDFFRRVLALEKRYNSRGLQVHNSIQTNGYTIDAEWVRIFREGQFLVGVSVDGTQALHDACRLDAAGHPTYDRVMQSLELLRQGGVDYNILCVVNQLIAQQPRAVFENLKRHGYLQFIPCLDDLDGSSGPYSLDPLTYGHFLIETFDLYEKAWRQGKPVSIRHFDNWVGMCLGQPPESCAMGGRCGQYYLLEADGSVYPCDFYVLDAWRMGNINETTFARLSRSPVGEAFRKVSWEVDDACRACPHYALCRGGCRRDREPVVEGHPALNRLCPGHKLFFDARGQRLQALARQIASQSQR